jgi:hypothetical protein
MQVGIFTVIMVGVGFSFFFWARHLGVASPVLLGSLLSSKVWERRLFR